MDNASASTSGDTSQECVQLQLFRKTLDSIIKAICRDISLKSFEECYGELLNHDPIRIYRVHKRFVERVEIEMKDQINQFIIEENINEKIQKLGFLEGSESSEKFKWRPSGDCSDDIRSHDCAQKQQLKTELEADLETEELENEKLKEEVDAGRKEVEDLSDDIALLTDVTSKLNLHSDKMKNMLENALENLEPAKKFEN